MTPTIYCPKCWSNAVYWVSAIEMTVAYACDDCGYEFVVNHWCPDNDDDDICAANEIIDDEDAAYAPPADSRESEE